MLKGMEDRTITSRLMLPKLNRKKQRLHLRNSLDSIPEDKTESQIEDTKEKQVHFRKQTGVTPRTPTAVKPKLTVIPEINTQSELQRLANTGSSQRSEGINAYPRQSFRGSKIHSREPHYEIEAEQGEETEDIEVTGLPPTWKHKDSYLQHKSKEVMSGQKLIEAHYKQHQQNAKTEDSYKSKRLFTGSKVKLKPKRLRFLRAI